MVSIIYINKMYIDKERDATMYRKYPAWVFCQQTHLSTELYWTYSGKTKIPFTLNTVLTQERNGAQPLISMHFSHQIRSYVYMQGIILLPLVENLKPPQTSTFFPDTH